MKTLLTILLISLMLMSCSEDKPTIEKVKFNVISATTKQPIPNCVLEVRESFMDSAKLIGLIAGNSAGEIEIPKNYNSYYGTLRAWGYDAYDKFLLNITPQTGSYEMEPLFWVRMRVRIQSDSLAAFNLMSAINWNSQKPKVDTTFVSAPYLVRYPSLLNYGYSLKSNPSLFIYKPIPVSIVERDTVEVNIEL